MCFEVFSAGYHHSLLLAIFQINKRNRRQVTAIYLGGHAIAYVEIFNFHSLRLLMEWYDMPVKFMLVFVKR